MSRNPLAAVILSGLIIGSVFYMPTAAGAATVSKIERPPQVSQVTASNAENKSSGGRWITVQAYPSPYGSLSGISKVVYGNARHWPNICSANGIKNCNLIHAGQKLLVSSLTSPVPVVIQTPQAPAKVNIVSSVANWVHPIRVGNPTSSCFGMRWGTMHKGIDYPAPYGTPIHAIGYGTVVKAGWIYHGYGISVLINHGNGLYTHYAHASRLAVSPGTKVVPGQVIAYVGSTGDSTGNHLHFEVHTNGVWSQINPAPWLRAHGVKTGC